MFEMSSCHLNKHMWNMIGGLSKVDPCCGGNVGHKRLGTIDVPCPQVELIINMPKEVFSEEFL